MAYSKTGFRWMKSGIMPPETLQNEGFTAGSKVPADYLNAQWSATYEAIKELQEKSAEKTVIEASLKSHAVNSLKHNNYATCNTAASTAAKTVTLADFTLNTGTSVSIKFSAANTATAPTLNVNSTGAKSLKQANGSVFTNINASVYTFIYDGTNYVVQDATVVEDSVTSTSTTSAASAASVKKAYDEAIAAKEAIIAGMPDATTTTKGGVIVGDGLNVNKGVLSANYHINNDIDLSAAPSNYATGTTYTTVNINSSNTLQQACNNILNDVLGYALSTTSITFKYRITTMKRSNALSRQEIEIYSNGVESFGQKSFVLFRESSVSTGEWSSAGFKPQAQIMSFFGDPSALGIAGMRGMVAQDLTTGIIYKKTTGTSAQVTLGWVDITSDKVDKVAGKTLSTNDFTDALKTKLNDITEGANKTTVEDSVTSTSTTSAASAASVKKAYDLANVKADKTLATATIDGLMSKDNFTKLAGIATGATNTTIEDSVTSTSKTNAASAASVKKAYDLANVKADANAIAYFVKNDITLDMLSSDFEVGTTYTTVTLSASSSLQQACNAIVNATLNYTLATDSVYLKYRITTVKRSNTYTKQIIEVLINAAGSVGYAGFKIYRESSISSGEWQSAWKVESQLIGYSGDPNTNVAGMKGMLCFDNSNLTMYKKTSGTISPSTAGWVELTPDISGKVDKETGKSLSTNDYTNAEKTKLAGIATGANNTTVLDSVTSTSTTSAASSASVKKAYDLASASSHYVDDTKTLSSAASTFNVGTTITQATSLQSAFNMVVAEILGFGISSTDDYFLYKLVTQKTAKSTTQKIEIYANVLTVGPVGALMFELNRVTNSVGTWQAWQATRHIISCKGNPEGSLLAYAGTLVYDVIHANLYKKRFASNTITNTDWVLIG